ncbi:MAG: hypothetical protein RSC06_00020 [Clostridia bacterium]
MLKPGTCGHRCGSRFGGGGIVAAAANVVAVVMAVEYGNTKNGDDHIAVFCKSKP